MILFNNGRYSTVRTPEEEEQLLASDVEILSPEEREALDVILAEMQEGPSQTARAIAQAEYTSEPVDLRTFIYDDYYLGNTCGGLYPVLFEDLQAIWDGGYTEVVITGSIGFGKSFMTSIAITRILYELSLLRDPQHSFGLAKGSDVSITVFSVGFELAQKVAFENIVTKVQASPYFQEHFPFEVTKKEIRFPRHIWVAPRATTDGSALGLNTVAAWVDEADFIKTKKSAVNDPRFAGGRGMADVIYDQIKRRMKSRFAQRGRLPGKLFIVSSKATTKSFSNRLLAANKNNPDFYVVDRNTWEVKPPGTYGPKRFGVFVGNEQVPSKILTDEEWEYYKKEGVPEGAALLEVPEELRADFKSDLEGAIRDMGGISTVSISPYIQRRETIANAVELHRQKYPDARHPFTREEWEPGRGGEFIWSRLVKEETRGPRHRRGELGTVPIINPRAQRAVHIDGSLNKDATGFCMAHVAGFKDVERRTEDGRIYRERAPIYVVDFVIRIVPPVGDEIVLGDVRQIIYDLSAHGFLITHVTLDGWQSIDGIQQLNRKGYTAEVLSVDRTLNPYENLKSALYEGRVLMYEYEPLLEELRTIQKDNLRGKVDHPPEGSKDIADAVAACLYTLSQNRLAEPVPILRVRRGDDDLWLPEQRDFAAAAATRISTDPCSWREVLPPFILGGRG